MKKIKPYLLFIIVIIIDLIIRLDNADLGTLILQNTYKNFFEMFSIIPPIFLLLGLFDVWVPRETIIRYMGEKSGITGIILGILLGSAAAGPLYAAFPVAVVMMKKGAKFSNILIFLGAWSTMKIPQILFEMSTLGMDFAITRWVVDVVGIIVMAMIIERLISPEEKAEIYKKHIEGSA